MTSANYELSRLLKELQSASPFRSAELARQLESVAGTARAQIEELRTPSAMLSQASSSIAREVQHGLTQSLSRQLPAPEDLAPMMQHISDTLSSLRHFQAEQLHTLADAMAEAARSSLEAFYGPEERLRLAAEAMSEVQRQIEQQARSLNERLGQEEVRSIIETQEQFKRSIQEMIDQQTKIKDLIDAPKT